MCEWAPYPSTQSPRRLPALSGDQNRGKLCRKSRLQHKLPTTWARDLVETPMQQRLHKKDTTHWILCARYATEPAGETRRSYLTGWGGWSLLPSGSWVASTQCGSGGCSLEPGGSLGAPALPSQIVKVDGKPQRPIMSGWLRTQTPQRWGLGSHHQVKYPHQLAFRLRVGKIQNEGVEGGICMYLLGPQNQDYRNEDVMTWHIFYCCVLGMYLFLCANHHLFFPSLLYTRLLDV